MRSLRARVMAVAAIVALAPFVLIVASVIADRAIAAWLSDHTARVLERCVDLSCAEREHARVVRLNADGAVIDERDAARPSVTGWFDALATTLRAMDKELPRFREREPCSVSSDGTLLACQACRGDLCVQTASVRVVRSLYSHRYQALKLAIFVLLLGLCVGWFASRRMVRPIEALRDEVLARAQAALPGTGVAIARRDEVGELSRAFDALLRSLHDRSTAHLALLADVAHEMKTPIATIRSAEESLAGASDTQRTRLLASIAQSSARLDALVTELLELGRAEAGLKGYERERVDVLALCRGIAGEDPRVTVEGEPLIAMADGPSLERALKNLIDNARSFAATRVTVTVRDGRVSVKDDGPGIPAADLERVFERFFTTRRTTGGTGLGLALSRAIIEAHGGTVMARAAANGAELVVTLPPPA